MASVQRLNAAVKFMLSDEYRYKILKKLQANPQTSQRALALDLGISIGKANYCLQALIEKGLIKANNFKNNHNKKAYMYLLTPRGVAEKLHSTQRFLQTKMNEYETLQHEIEILRKEINQ